MAENLRVDKTGISAVPDLEAVWQKAELFGRQVQNMNADE